MPKGNLNTAAWHKAIKIVQAYNGAQPTPELEAAHQVVNKSVYRSLYRMRCMVCQRLTGRVQCHGCAITYKHTKSGCEFGMLCATCARGLSAYMGGGVVYSSRTRARMYKVQMMLKGFAGAAHNTPEGQAAMVASAHKWRVKLAAKRRQKV